MSRWCAACCSAVFEKMVLYSTGVEHQVEADPADGGGQEQQQRARATVNEACPKCNHPELQYYTMQCVATLERALLVLQRRPRAHVLGGAAQSVTSVLARGSPAANPARHSHAVCIACRPGCDQRMRGRPSSTSAPSAATPSRRTTEDMHTGVTVGAPIMNLLTARRLAREASLALPPPGSLVLTALATFGKKTHTRCRSDRRACSCAPCMISLHRM